jgi:hypothetical protein
MRLFLKVAFIGVGLVLIGVAVLVILAASQSDKLARAYVQRTLAYALKTDVAMDAAEVSLLGQSLSIQGLTIQNPAGFEPGPAMEFERITTTFDGGTLFSEAPVIREVLLDGVKVNLHLEPGEGTNLGALLREAERTSLERGSQQPRGVRRAYTIDSLHCDGARIDVKTSIVPVDGLGLDVAPFTLTGISKDHPVTAGQVSAIFIRSLLAEALTFKGLLRPLGEFLREELDKLMGDEPPAATEPAPQQDLP